jgi:hypothetical protein
LELNVNPALGVYADPTDVPSRNKSNPDDSTLCLRYRAYSWPFVSDPGVTPVNTSEPESLDEPFRESNPSEKIANAEYGLVLALYSYRYPKTIDVEFDTFLPTK